MDTIINPADLYSRKFMLFNIGMATDEGEGNLKQLQNLERDCFRQATPAPNTLHYNYEISDLDTTLICIQWLDYTSTALVSEESPLITGSLTICFLSPF